MPYKYPAGPNFFYDVLRQLLPSVPMPIDRRFICYYPYAIAIGAKAPLAATSVEAAETAIPFLP